MNISSISSITKDDVDYLFVIARFLAGSLGTLTYFMCVKYEFLDIELENIKKNTNSILNKKEVLMFFCLLGGFISIAMDIRNIIGCFFQGFMLRVWLTSLWSAKGNK